VSTRVNAGALWERVEPLLLKCEKPTRYIDSEFGAVHDEDARYRFVLIYPDVYEVGLPNQGHAILYRIINGIEGACAERAYLPWIDMADLMRENDIPLYSLESFTPLRDAQVVGFTLQHELCYTNLVEALDLAGIPVLASERGEDCPLVVAGGPVVYNCEPVAELFDAIMIGEGEEVIVELVEEHMRLLDEGASRGDVLRALAQIPGVYVPAFYEAGADGAVIPCVEGVPEVVRKRVLVDFDALSPQAIPVVPFGELVHDRLAVEILRGCSRGCRFCQAGMTYRPVRERPADSIVNATLAGLAATGYDEVSLTSLSSTDHSQIEEVLRRLDAAVDGTGTSVSLPSQRLDGFGVKMAHLAAGSKKGGLTFAPEAGTQRLRDIINKNVTEDDLFDAITAAFEAGWRRLKLYFMLGLPFETDEDVAGIADLANRAYAFAKDCVDEKQRGNVRLTISCSIFVPKPQTPFQWCGQVSMEEAQRRVGIIHASRLHKGIDFNWHDPRASLIEGAFSRGGRELLPVVLEAWRRGCRFDAWSEQFSLETWQDAARACGIDLQEQASRDLEVGAPLPWSHISAGVDERFLAEELEAAREGATTPDCTFEHCTNCGVCPNLDVDVFLGGSSRGR
jgi:radical SAM family uncharacterized protein